MKTRKFEIVSHIVLIIISVLIVLPFWLLIAASFSDNNWIVANGYSFFPKKLSLTAYSYIFLQYQVFGKAYMISILVTVVGVCVGLFITATFAYMLAKSDLPGNRIITFLVVFTMLFNGGLVATYLNYTTFFHVKNSFAAYLVPNLLTNAFSIIMVRGYFKSSIPEELKEAGRIDGMSEYGIFFKIVIPLSKPILATVALMSGIAYWNDWQNGLYYIDSSKMWGIQNVLNAINSSISYLSTTVGVSGINVPQQTLIMAIAVIGVLPILIVYPFFQQYFVQGIVMGAIKG